MSEINEDNCVLSEVEIGMIDVAFGQMYQLDDVIKIPFEKLFIKITKLNDLVKYMEKRGILIYSGDDSHNNCKEKQK
jgi:hypothetical protein